VAPGGGWAIAAAAPHRDANVIAMTRATVWIARKPKSLFQSAQW